jgi:hypothetical protein
MLKADFNKARDFATSETNGSTSFTVRQDSQMDHHVERIDPRQSGGTADCFLTSILLIYRNCSTALLTINDAASSQPVAVSFRRTLQTTLMTIQRSCPSALIL